LVGENTLLANIVSFDISAEEMGNRRAIAVGVTLLPSISRAFEFVRNVDFDYPYERVQALNISDLSDTATQFFRFNSARWQRIGPDRPLLTLQGCERLCHDGYQLWSGQDTLLRFVLWVLPAVVLVGHFHFAPLPATNIC
jgi:hypothetical protein